MNASISSLKTELCYHVEIDSSALSDEKIAILQWILKEPQQVDLLSRTSVWDSAVTNATEFIIEIGPRFVIDKKSVHKHFTDKKTKEQKQHYDWSAIIIIKANYSIT